MPIEFACPSCHRGYRVKDELAGKGAKCGNCGQRMRIPQTSLAKAAPKSAASKADPAASQPPKVEATTSSAAGLGSWLDEELESSPAASVPPVASATCPACGAGLSAGAVLCVACGYDTRTGATHETRYDFSTDPLASKSAKKRSALGSTASLLRGSVFSFLGAMLGAVIWAVFAYLTNWESGIIAWGLGGLAGFGMALGHEDKDGTFAGIIAAFMSLVGIIAAKILIIVIVVAAFIANVVEVGDPVEMKRMMLVHSVAAEKLRAQGINPDDANARQWEQAQSDAKAELARLSEEELEARWERFAQGPVADEGFAEVDMDPFQPNEENAGGGIADADIPEEMELDAPNPVGLFFKLMFSPIDGIFILLAFFTAYKVGSGQMTD